MTLTYQWPATSVVENHWSPPGPWGATGMSCPPRSASALTVKRTVAAELPAGCADVMCSEDTLMVGAPGPRSDRTQDRCAGSTVAATAAVLSRPSAAQNAATACSAEAACTVVSVPETGGGLAAAAEVPKKIPGAETRRDAEDTDPDALNPDAGADAPDPDPGAGAPDPDPDPGADADADADATCDASVATCDAGGAVTWTRTPKS